MAELDNHTSGTGTADTSPDSPLQPSNPPQALMHILDKHTKALTKYTEPDGTVILDVDTVLFDVFGARTDLQAYISDVIGEDDQYTSWSEQYHRFLIPGSMTLPICYRPQPVSMCIRTR